MSLLSSYPAAGDTDAPPDTKIELNFSAPLDASMALPSATLGLTENGSAVPITTRVDGSTLIVVPSRRLADNAQFVLSYGAINGVDGTPGAAGTLSFSTPVYSLQNPTAPILLTLIPGAPCALSGAVAPGSCAGGQSTDPSYLPFTLESNRSIVAAFSQPMDPTTLLLGTTCGTGAIRIEEDDANGDCLQPVPGVLQLSDRGFRFTPNVPWTPGASYVMTLVAGPDSNCDFGEICSTQGTPFNTAPLSGFSAGAGGPDVVIPFTGIATTQDSFQPLQTDPFADLNGNGVFDSDETSQDSNRVGLVISGTTGVVSSASFNGPYCGSSTTEACSYLYAQMPASVGQVLPSCPLDVNAQPTSNGGPCLQVRLWPGIILSTSTSMDTTALFGLVPLNNINTGALLMRTRESTTPQLGYILSDPNSSSPQLVLQQSLYVDAPDLSILDGLVSHDLKSKPISFNFKGPVTFLPDGRMSVAVTNLDDETLTVNLSSFGITAGSIEMLIAAGELHITLAGPLLR